MPGAKKCLTNCLTINLEDKCYRLLTQKIMELNEFWKVGEYEAFQPFVVIGDINDRNINSA